ncbi:hypothetical protein GWK36_00730 [Caldichromatium japonicum]|uniref:Uncharacterized protein n=1 Tax=Caldichromatium japonicum TaxID=2699430 RepID=A0A6G7VA73_9GAMM|nr:hypothetical protein [Caldichromatium japonicum]QIK36766.1 hypothetical protein GWK36_00730 [Caldichromatium japonicum]
MRHFDANLRSAKAIGEFLRDYYDAVRAFGDPNQESLFGDEPAPTKTAVLHGVKERGQADEAGQFVKAADPAKSIAQTSETFGAQFSDGNQILVSGTPKGKPLNKSIPLFFVRPTRSKKNSHVNA